MSQPGPEPPTGRLRREPPRFLPVSVQRVDQVSRRLIRLTLTGPSLHQLIVRQPASSVRLLLPSPGTKELVVPSWAGNEFLLPEERRPVIRTFTPLPATAHTLGIAVVIHDGGVASEWALTAEPGDQAAVSGPGRGYTIDQEASAFLLVGDETAIPAMTQLVPALPVQRPVQLHIEVAHADARLPMPDHPRLTVEWHDLAPGAAPGDAMVAAVRGEAVDAGIRIWVAGEAAAVQRIRHHLFEERGLPRTQVTARGYWKHGRVGDV